jgi:single-stranded-DNA-specific exonuclease
MERYNRPAFVLSVEGDTARGSGRSVEGVSLVEALARMADILTKFGGHDMAAGVTLPRKNVRSFFERFDAIVGELKSRSDKPATIDYDGESAISDFDDAYFAHMGKLGPFGCGNPEPVFRINRLSPLWVKPAAEKHSRGCLKDPAGYSVGFIAFGRDVSSLPEAPSWDVLAKPSINTFHGESKLQIQIVDIRPSA